MIARVSAADLGGLGIFGVFFATSVAIVAVVTGDLFAAARLSAGEKEIRRNLVFQIMDGLRPLSPSFLTGSKK
jgi:hypothetical protein